MSFSRRLTVIAFLATMLTLVLVGCTEKLVAPRELGTQIKIKISAADGLVDHGWLTIDGDTDNRHRMALVDAFLQSDVIELMPGPHSFEAIAVDAEDAILFRGASTDTIPSGVDNFTIEIVLHAVQPDLVVSSLTHLPASPTTSDQVTFTAVVRNRGSSASGPSKLEIRVGNETTALTYDVPALAPNVTFQVQRQQTLAVAQNYLITVTADILAQVQESNEQNNVATETVTVANAPQPDLVVSSLTHLPASPTTSDQVTFTAVVRNRGSSASGPSKLEIRIGSETTALSYDVPVLAPNATFQAQRQQTLAVAQNYLITATADILAQVQESNEQNNVATETVTVANAPQPVCEVMPLTLDFGTVPVNGAGEDPRIFVVTNIGEVDLPVDIATGCGDFSVVAGGGARILIPGQELTVAVAFDPQTVGSQNCVITTGTYCQGVNCLGVGEAPPACEISPATLDFGDLEVGSSRDLTFTITNTGGGELSGYVTDDCPDFDVIGGHGSFTLTGEQSRVVTVRYAPSFAGYHSCWVSTQTACGNVSCTGRASPAVCFDFDEGAGQQGWSLHHVLGYPSTRIYKDLPDSTNFQNSWSDVVNYPSSYNTDPLGNGQGSYWLDTIVDGNPIIRYPVAGDTWWMAQVRSPNLDSYPAWQEAIGFTTQALDHLSWAGGDDCYFSLHFTIWDEDQLRERTWPDVFGTALPVDQWRYDTIYFNNYALPPNWHLRRVFVQIWGTRANLYQGGFYLDEICPIAGGGAEPLQDRRVLESGAGAGRR